MADDLDVAEGEDYELVGEEEQKTEGGDRQVVEV